MGVVGHVVQGSFLKIKCRPDFLYCFYVNVLQVRLHGLRAGWDGGRIPDDGYVNADACRCHGSSAGGAKLCESCQTKPQASGNPEAGLWHQKQKTCADYCSFDLFNLDSA